jgi:predicted secreted protein
MTSQDPFVNGKLIQEGTTNSKITFNSELRQGIYILKLNSNKEELRFKIVK